MKENLSVGDPEQSLSQRSPFSFDGIRRFLSGLPFHRESSSAAVLRLLKEGVEVFHACLRRPERQTQTFDRIHAAAVQSVRSLRTKESSSASLFSLAQSTRDAFDEMRDALTDFNSYGLTLDVRSSSIIASILEAAGFLASASNQYPRGQNAHLSLEPARDSLRKAGHLYEEALHEAVSDPNAVSVLKKREFARHLFRLSEALTRILRALEDLILTQNGP